MKILSLCRFKNSILVLLLLLLVPYAQAQTKERFFRAGIKAGANLNRIDGKGYDEGFNFNYQAGAFLQFNVSKKIGLQPELNLVQGNGEFTNDVNSVYEDLFYDGAQKKAKFTTIEVPLLINLNLGSTNKVKMQAGPFFSALIRQVADSLQHSQSLYKSADFGLTGGLWFQLPVVNFGARYKVGLANLNAINDREKWKSQAIQIFVGLTF